MASILDIIVNLRDHASAGLNGIRTGLMGLHQTANSVSGVFFNLKNSLLAIGIGAGLKEVVSTFAAFDLEMRKVQAITDATGKQFEQLTAKARQLGRETQFTATQAAQGLQLLAQAGFTAEEAMQALPDTLNLAAAGAMSMKEAAEVAATVINGMQQPIAALGNVTDILASAANKTNASVSSLGEAFRYAGPIARTAGESLQEVSAVLGGLHDNGVKGTIAGHSYKRMVTALLNPTDRAAATLHRLGVATSDSSGRFKGLIPILQELKQKKLDVADADRIFGKYVLSAALSTIAYSDKIKTLADSFENVDGAGKKFRETLEGGISGAIKKTQSVWQELLLSFGGGMIDEVIGILDHLKAKMGELIEWIKKLQAEGTFDYWAERVKQAVIGSINVLESMGKSLMEAAEFFSPLIKAGLEMAPALVGIAVAAGTLASALGVLRLASIAAGTGMNALGASSFFATIANKIQLIQGLSRYMSLFQIATTSVGTALTIAGSLLAAFGVGWTAGKIFNQFDGLKNAVQGLIGKLDELASKLGWTSNEYGKRMAEMKAETNATMAKFAEFKDVSLDAMGYGKDGAGLAKAPIEALNKTKEAIQGSIQYWAAYITQLRQNDDGSLKTAQAIKKGSDELARLRGELGLTKKAIEDYNTASAKALREASQQHTNHTDLVTKMNEKMLAKEKASLAISIAEKEKLYAAGNISYQQLLAEKEKLTAESEERQNKIRLSNAATLQSAAEDELKIAEMAKNEELRILQEKIDAGGVMENQGRNEKLAILEKYNNTVAGIERVTAQQVESEKVAIAQDGIKKWLAIYAEKDAAAKKSMNDELAAVSKAEADKLITAEEAAKKKTAIEEAYHSAKIAETTKTFESLKGIYESDSETFKQVLALKEAAESEYNNKAVGGLTSTVQEYKGAYEEIGAAHDTNIDSMATAAEDGTKTEILAIQNKIAQISALESQGVISHEQAVQQKMAATEELLRAELSAAETALQETTVKYGQGTVEYEQAVAAKIAATQKLADFASNPPSFDINTAPAEESLGRVSEKGQQITEVISHSISMNIETEQAEVSLNGLNSKMEATLADIMKPLPLDIQTELVEADLDKIQEDAEQTFQDIQAALEDSLDASLEKEREIADEIKAIQEEIADSKISAEDKIRKLQQQGMSDYEAYQDQVLQIQEKISQAQQLASTDTEKSISLFKEAQSAAASLGNEVKDGEQVVVSEQAAIQTAIGLVETAQKGLEGAANSRKAALQQEMTAAKSQTQVIQEGLAKVTAAIQEIARQKEGLSKPIVLDIDTSPAKAALQSLAKEAQNAAAAAYRAYASTQTGGYDPGGYAAKTRAEMLKSYKQSEAEWLKFKKLAGAGANATVNIKGKASPEDTFTNTMKRVTGLWTSFKSSVQSPLKASASLNGVAIKAGITNSQPASTTSQLSNLFGNVKDLGKMRLQVGGAEGTVTGNVNFLSQLQTTLRRERLAGAV